VRNKYNSPVNFTLIGKASDITHFS